jgi:hypothetical protein
MICQANRTQVQVSKPTVYKNALGTEVALLTGGLDMPSAGASGDSTTKYPYVICLI